MSRKTTSGADASSAASASAPLRHSPATANSGKAASSCPTPRRAAGSSSTIKTFHSACVIFGSGVRFRDQLTVWSSQRSDCAAFRPPDYLERGALAVQGPQSLPRVFDAVALRHDDLRVNANSVVQDRKFEHGAVAPRGDDQAARVGALRNAVANRILHQMLQRETGRRRGQERVVYVEFRAQSVGESRLLYGDVLPDEFELFSEGDFIQAVAAERRPQHFAQLLDDAHGGLAVVVTNEHCDRVERVEEKVRVNLSLQRGETRARESLGKTGHLDVPLARFDEV